MSSHERESSNMSSRGGGERGGGGGGDGGAPPSSGSATTTVNSGAPSSATTATTISIKPTNSLMGNQQSQRSSSTESDGGSARREYGKGRRPPRSRRSDEEEDGVGDEEDDEEDEAEERQGDGSRESMSGGGGGGRGGGRGGGAGRTGSDGSSSAPHASLASSSTSGSPVRRLPSVIRPPPSSSSQQQQQQSPSLYENNHSAQQQRQSMPHYYSSMNHAASPRDAALSPHTISSPSAMLDSTSGGRVLAQKRRLQQQQGSEYTAAGSSPTLPPPQSQQQLNQAAAVTARSMYEASQHRSSSNSSSSTARSGVGVTGVSLPTHNLHNHSHHAQSSALDDDDDDDQDDPLRFETRGSHGPRDEARYETWTSKQLRKKCSHLKLRGLKNVKKHVMVEALYRYYRNNQRVKSNANERGSGGGMGGNNSLHLQTRSPGTSGAHDRPMNNNTISARNATSSMRSEDNAVYEERYAQQQQHRYENAMTASNGSSSHYASTANLVTLPRGNHATPSLNTSLRIQARRASPSSRPTTRHGSGGGSATYNSVIDLEESKYDALDNEVRITSEDVIRLVDVILSPEFVDRLSSELSRWQFWVDVREKYISLASTNGPSSYGAARGLTALGGDHHTPGVAETASGDASGRLPLMSSTYMRPSAKWSSMQLWEMWKELTFAYTKTCFEFTAAGVDERNYIQFCDGRPDVFYLHQRLHARPDLLHLIKSNEYIEEKCSSDAASEHAPHMNAEQQNAASALMGVGSPVAQQGGGGRPHKRFKRIVPAGGANVGDRQGAGSGGNGSGSGGVAAAVSGNYGSGSAGGNGGGNVGMAVGAGAASGGNGGGANANTSESDVATVNKKSSGRPSGSNGSSTNSGNGGSGGRGGGPAQYLASNGMRVGTTNSPNGQQEEGSTENSETTGEEGSLEKTSNSNRTSDSTRRETLADQKYFGLLLQNFEAIFESLHNKKVLLAALRKDNSAPDHLIADLHDDIHVLSALKKDFRNKLRQALE